MKGKVVLITGASSGIGAATALLFAKESTNIAISYKENKEGAEEISSKIKELGSECFVVKANLTSDSEAKDLASTVFEHFGKIDILVNNAGRYIGGDDWNGEYSVWEESLKQNLLSTMSVSKYVLRGMQKERAGTIVNISSRYSVSGQFDAPAYAAAKAAIVNITQAQAKLMAPWGRSNAVSPGVVRAGYWLKATKGELEENMAGVPLQKMVEPEDIAEAVYFLASDKAAMITAQNLIVDGGFTLK